MMAKQLMDIEMIRKSFPILNRKVNKKDLIYLDNAAMSLTPKSVTDAMNEYYHKYNSNVHRGIYKISQQATKEYELAHKKVADFINAKFREIIFTKSTTESLNLLAYTLSNNLKEGDEIILTEMEHHSNLVPWQQLAKRKGLVLNYIPVEENTRIDIERVNESITDKTKIVSIAHVSNVLGIVNDIKRIGKIAHSKGALFVVDAAQAVPHIAIDVKDINCDFLAFSGHKMLGPTGIGVLYGKEKLLDKLDPFLFGGDMISEVTFKDASWNELPWKFEAGTPNIAEAIGLGKAVDFLKKISIDKIMEYENYLTEYILSKMREIDRIIIYGPKNIQNRSPVISFNLEGIHPHDVSALLDKEGIAIRGGHMCAMPLITNNLKSQAICRASLYFYNTTDEIDKFVHELKKIKEVFQSERKY